MGLFDRIVNDPQFMNGQACLKGSRLTVRRIIEIVALYPDRAERLKEFPELDDEGIRQALRFASLYLPDSVSEANALVA